MPAILNLATYRFVSLQDLPTWRQRILDRAISEGIRGTVLLSREGINLFVAGEEPAARRWFAWLVDQPPFQGMTAKESWGDEIPFNRMLVRLKREIISMGVDEIVPERETSPKLSPDELKRWLDEGKEIVLLDVRNDYEVEVGTFHDAQAIGVDHFREFPAAVERLPESIKQKPVVMFCTGGIRCEKAGPLIQGRGFGEVYQLDGGILAYLERHGQAHYRGDCFVFDKRVALNGDLRPSGLAQCYACQTILSVADQQSPRYQPGKSCPHCHPEESGEMDELIRSRMRALRTATEVLPGSVPHDNIRPINVPLRLDGVSLMECVMGMHPHLGEAYWAEEFARGRILRGKMAVDGERTVRVGQRFGHLFPDTVEPAVNTDIQILWEDESIVVVNKPAPLPMHPSGRFNLNTLGAILERVYSPQTTLRPVHRLDANTTGLVVFAKSKGIATAMVQRFESGTVTKTYLAQCHGWPEDDFFCCDEPISRDRTTAGARTLDPQGDRALTEFRVLYRGQSPHLGRWSLLAARPRTGRTNQIRVHLWGRGLPILGDPLYLPGRELGVTQTLAPGSGPLRLHAWKLAFAHPASGASLELRSPAPQWPEPGGWPDLNEACDSNENGFSDAFSEDFRRVFRRHVNPNRAAGFPKGAATDE